MLKFTVNVEIRGFRECSEFVTFVSSPAIRASGRLLAQLTTRRTTALVDAAVNSDRHRQIGSIIA